ncbi:hypothetical protein Asulf_00038 [Archaeoglobus sulfaticallidus PM70-1]|uniref:Sugar 3,4-ketoisomerase QdtA cupin domain-containing protein n=1 Tax=Archaeoglobus sulfaticallidus PM70-1 TaxID=387631 RepID=N0B8Y5_9EURY|nr:WbuC family cupin fold metalloprotein [Archaeoglobus sulfaticallidus]AGK60074.1 hypothetical protein Asulf_00038 [Archaeoglobus sulfaticallidus PM70-1]
MKINVLERDGTRYAIYIPSDAWKKGLNFYSDEKDFVQVGIWGYDKGKFLQPHIHNEVKREVTRTQEVIFLRKGKIKAYIFDKNENLIETLELKEGDILILLDGGHGYKILEDNTFVLEVKNGPYFGPEVDRKRIKMEKFK